jgi:putative ABC transport system permease protein
MNIPLLQGRWISEADRENSRPVVVINRTMANTFFHNESPIGKRFQVGATPQKDVPWMEVVGVVADVKQTLASDPATEMYVPFRQADAVLPVNFLTFVVRSEGDPRLLANDLRAAIHQVSPNQPLLKIRTMQENLASSIAQPRFRTVLLAIFAMVALLIAAVGIYGVMAYATTQRSRELGIRLALGSSRERVFQLVLGDGMRLTIAGVILGTAGALLLARYVKTLLYSVAASDVVTLLISTVVVLAVGATASYLPARRAARVQVSEILREN